MGCCCGCPGTTCSNCTDTTPIALYASISGATLITSALCTDISCGGNNSFKLTYGGSASVPDVSLCINQFSGETACKWGCADFVDSIFSATFSIYALAACASIPVNQGLGSARIVAVAKASSWELWGYAPATLNPVFFHATASASPVRCSSVSLSFTADTVIGQCYTIPCASGIGTLGVGVATGGTGLLEFRRSCCP